MRLRLSIIVLGVALGLLARWILGEPQAAQPPAARPNALEPMR